MKQWIGANPFGAPAGISLAECAERRPRGPDRWPAARVAAVEALWGDGFLSPGGAEEATRLATPLGLTDRAKLLLLGGGLGGPAEVIAAGFGSWVSSFEADPGLAEIAAFRRPARDSRNRITIASWDAGAPAFARASANHALALEVLRGSAPDGLVGGLAVALRPHGEIVLTELVAADAPDVRDREFAAWCRLENRQPALPKLEDISQAFARQHFEIRVIEDLSERHMEQTLAGWRSSTKAMAAGPKPKPAEAAAFVTEAELWLLRMRLMRRLGFRLLRWHAVRGIS